jgi:hypothetical protein
MMFEEEDLFGLCFALHQGTTSALLSLVENDQGFTGCGKNSPL